MKLWSSDFLVYLIHYFFFLFYKKTTFFWVIGLICCCLVRIYSKFNLRQWEIYQIEIFINTMLRIEVSIFEQAHCYKALWKGDNISLVSEIKATKLPSIPFSIKNCFSMIPQICQSYGVNFFLILTCFIYIAWC